MGRPSPRICTARAHKKRTRESLSVPGIGPRVDDYAGRVARRWLSGAPARLGGMSIESSL
jgi:hypothetical protein